MKALGRPLTDLRSTGYKGAHTSVRARRKFCIRYLSRNIIRSSELIDTQSFFMLEKLNICFSCINFGQWKKRVCIKKKCECKLLGNCMFFIADKLKLDAEKFLYRTGAKRIFYQTLFYTSFFVGDIFILFLSLCVFFFFSF